MYIFIYPNCLSGRLLDTLMDHVHESGHEITENPFMASYGIRTLDQPRMDCFPGPRDIILKDCGKVDTVPHQSLCVDVGTFKVIGTNQQGLDSWLSRARDFFAEEV